ncbi:hypothetical protein GpartN1_g3141.t1 [Galdieria partita]|uniref:Uncharacterized protein n=1 Tax=Galdieria partita TaxID=83374 RepID=A0A9C7UQA0_9RHOD|nr:hypothetical protein GpartN1_g3141.t1 [Galdieria partita]
MEENSNLLLVLWLVELLTLGYSYIYLVVTYGDLKPQGSLYDFAVTIYSYDRPRLLNRLLLDILEQEQLLVIRKRRLFLQIVDDNSIGCHDVHYWRSQKSENVNDFYQVNSKEQLLGLPCTFPSRLFGVLETLEGTLDWQIWISKRHFGKHEHWKMVRRAFETLKDVHSTFYVFLQDDMRICCQFFDRAQMFWSLIEDRYKMTLSLHCDNNRVNYSGWTMLNSTQKHRAVVLSGWVESSNFLCESRFLEWMNYTFPMVNPSRWYRRKYASSGVGETLSNLLYRAGYSMYRTSHSLLYHCRARDSKMHPVIRKEELLETFAFIDGDVVGSRMELECVTVTCSMASTWPRTQLLYDSLYSLAPQIDIIYLYLNDYEHIPSFLHVDFVQIVSCPESSDLGDIGKFYVTPHADYHFTLDDDIIYPWDFVMEMISCYTSLPQPALLGVHGVMLDQEKLFRQDYFQSRTVISLEMAVPCPCQVNILGTGAMLYQPRSFNIPKEIFIEKNMADIYIAILAKSRNINLFIVNRSSYWLTEQRKDDIPSIYEDFIRNGQKRRKITKMLREFMPWKCSHTDNLSVCCFTQS